MVTEQGFIACSTININCDTFPLNFVIPYPTTTIYLAWGATLDTYKMSNFKD